jgi:hypothetical protein
LRDALRDHFLHALAWTLLRSTSLARTHAVLVRCGSLFATLETPEEARRLARRLARHGTCLSRSLAVAARAPDADVAIGVPPPGAGPFVAHAWVELNGVPIDPADATGHVIARLRGRRSEAHGLRGEAGRDRFSP